MSEPSILASWNRALRRQLDAIGVDSLPLYSAAGVDPHRMDDSEARYSLAQTNQLWQAAAQACQDPALGLRVSRFVSPATFHALGYALVASGSLREVFARIVSYHPLVGDTLALHLELAGDRYRFTFTPPPGVAAPAHEMLDAFAAMYVRTCRNRLGADYAPLTIHLQRPEPADPRPWRQLFRTHVHFGASENLLEFDATDFDSHLDDTDPEVAPCNPAPLDAPEALNPLAWEKRVRAAIESQLPEGEPSVERIAHNLRLSVLGLERHLADEGCRFDLLVNQCRQNLALQHILEPHSSLAEIAYLLGFENIDSFNRAFKRWTGMTPAQYRAGMMDSGIT